MTAEHPNNYPKLHNAAWPGVVGKGDGGEPPIDLDTMLDLTAAAEFEGVKFDGFDLFLYHPHFNIDGGDDEIQRLADKARARTWPIGTVVAPVWPPTGGGSAMGDGSGPGAVSRHKCKRLPRGRAAAATGRAAQRRRAHRLRLAGGSLVRRPRGQPETHRRDLPRGLQDRRRPRRAAGRRRRDLLGRHAQLEADAPTAGDGRPPADARLSGRHGPYAPLPAGLQRPGRRPAAARFRLARPGGASTRAYGRLTAALRPWTIDFHVAQNDATVHGSGSHDKTGRHCLPDDPSGKLDIPRHAGYWLRDERRPADQAHPPHLLGRLHVPQRHDDEAGTWNRILRAMVAVRDAHGWKE